MRKYIKVTVPNEWERINFTDLIPAINRPFESAKIISITEKNEKDEIRNSNYEEIQESI